MQETRGVIPQQSLNNNPIPFSFLYLRTKQAPVCAQHSTRALHMVGGLGARQIVGHRRVISGASRPRRHTLSAFFGLRTLLRRTTQNAIITSHGGELAFAVVHLGGVNCRSQMV